jgi:selenophosphate synthase
VAPDTRWSDGAAFSAEQADDSDRELIASLACDAQTSGGLLLCLPPSRAASCLASLRGAGLPAAQIGTLAAPAEGTAKITLL